MLFETSLLEVRMRALSDVVVHWMEGLERRSLTQESWRSGWEVTDSWPIFDWRQDMRAISPCDVSIGRYRCMVLVVVEDIGLGDMEKRCGCEPRQRLRTARLHVWQTIPAYNEVLLGTKYYVEI